MDKCTRFLYLSHKHAAKAHASLRICLKMPEHLLLAYLKHEIRWRLSTKFKPLALLDMSALAFIFVCLFDSLHPINNVLVIKGRVFLD